MTDSLHIGTRLRALERRVEATISGGDSPAVFPTLFAVSEALPLIADVVEAAENEVPLLRGRVLERAMEQRERDGLGFALDESPTLAALTALREHLEGGDESQQVRHAREPWTEAQLDSVRRLRYDKGGE